MKIYEIAKALANAYIERAELQVKIDEYERHLRDIEFSLTPSEGWPGKNEAQRDQARETTFRQDEAWRVIGFELDTRLSAKELLDGTIQALEAERRGAEWETRANLVTVLAANLRGGGNGAREEDEFDDVALLSEDEALNEAAALLNENEQEQAAMTEEKELAGGFDLLDDDIPF